MFNVFVLMPNLGATEVLIVTAGGILIIWPSWRTCTKAGFPGPLGLMAIVPFLNLILLFILAFSEWPA